MQRFEFINSNKHSAAAEEGCTTISVRKQQTSETVYFSSLSKHQASSCSQHISGELHKNGKPLVTIARPNNWKRGLCFHDTRLAGGLASN